MNIAICKTIINIDISLKHIFHNIDIRQTNMKLEILVIHFYIQGFDDFFYCH